MKFVSMLLAVLLMFSIVSVALARSGPWDRQQNVYQQLLPDAVMAPAVLHSIPPTTTGYDVIGNLTTAQVGAVTTARRGLSTTVDWRSGHLDGHGVNRLRPAPVMKI